MSVGNDVYYFTKTDRRASDSMSRERYGHGRDAPRDFGKLFGGVVPPDRAVVCD